MVRLRRVPGHLVAILGTILWAGFPATGWTWGGETHHYIARHYSQHLPAYMDGLRTYDADVDARVTDPDTRKPYTPGESYRHYIDIDTYPEFFSGTLPHDRAELESRYGAYTVLRNGVLPWAVGEVVTTLSLEFQAQQWSAATTTIADLCHYVGDATQPLHCTENYDGWDTGNSGIHSRYESDMMSNHVADLSTPPGSVIYYSYAVDAMFGIIGDSWAGVSTILQADDAARTAAGGQYNATYYASLWSGTEVMTRARINAATLATASFVYTAWVNAGQPPVPGSSAAPPPPAVGAHLEAGPSPFTDALTIRFAGTGPLRVDVFDIRGARVERLVTGAYGAGIATWRPVGRSGSGVYFVRLTGPGLSIVRRVTRAG